MTDRSRLADRDFRWLLLGQMTGPLGVQVSGVAPLLAVLGLHAPPLELGPRHSRRWPSP